MRTVRTARIIFSLIFITILSATLWASFEESVWMGFVHVFEHRWGTATLVDAYCGFFTFTSWVFYKEEYWCKRAFWFCLIFVFGNIAMSLYVLIAAYKLPGNSPIERLLLREASPVGG